MSTRKWYLTLVLALALTASACGPAQTPASTQPPAPQATQPPVPPSTAPPAAEPVVLTIGWLGIPDTLNPAYAFLTESYTIFDLVYNSLVREAPTGEYVGDLAKEWSSSEDGLTWTFALKDGIVWHDGTPFSADDIVWSINAVMSNPDGWATLANYTNGFAEVTALDDETVQITLDAPIGNMEYRLSFLYAMARKDFEQFETPEDLQSFLNEDILGTGPFKVNQFDKDAGVIILDANADYFDGRPNIDQVIFRTFDNADAMVQALRVGDIGLTGDVPNTAFETVKGFENVSVVQRQSRSFAELIINSAPEDHDPAPTANPALRDPQVRLAMAHAIDKQDLVDIVLQGLGSPGTTIVPPSLGGGFWHNSDIQDVEFDLDKANEILEAAGYTLGPDWVRAKGDVLLEMRLQYPSDEADYPRVADLLTEWFGQIGIRLTVEAVDPDTLIALCCPAADYDLMIWGWGSDPDPDFILSVMLSDQFVDGGWSDSGYSNPAYDEMYLAQQVAIERDERRQIIWDMQAMVYNDRPYIVFWYSDALEAYRSDRFTNFLESPLGLDSAFSLMQVEPVQ